jgi:glycosyltransferase involved in cell wall biosynthesis
VYAGSLAHADEVTSLLEAFAAVAKGIPEARLEVLGDDPNGDALTRFPALANALGIGARVAFRGAVSRETVAERIADAAALALPRPKTPWAEAGLSTKLAEYLATGRPVVVTAIGDIPLYLEDRVSALLVEPGDPDAFAAALRGALVDPIAAERIGRQGRDAAERHFSVAVHGPRVARFFESLL